MTRTWSMALLLAVSRCADPSADFAPEERARLARLVLTQATPPSDATNRYADVAEAATLGQQFFFDTRFSGPLAVADDGQNGGLGQSGVAGRVACASCHDPKNGGSDHRSQGPTSLGSAWTGRNAPTVLNAQLSVWFFWDGRKDSGWSQSLGPVESAAEHNTSRLHVARVIALHYRASFEALFGVLPALDDTARFPDTLMTPEAATHGRPGDAFFTAMAPADQEAVNRVFSSFGKAISAYERLLVSVNAPFDRYMRGERAALGAAAIRGAKLFIGRASCDECHSGPTLSDGRFHNHAIPQLGANLPQIDPGRQAGIGKVLADPFNGAGAYSDDAVAGAALLSGLAPSDADLGAFKTPTLRNLMKNAPYMHTGGFKTLWDVLVWYRDAAGTGGFVGTRDPAVQPLLLSDAELGDLNAFLNALEGAPLPDALTTAPELPP